MSYRHNFLVLSCFRLNELIIERQYPDRPVRFASWSGSFKFYVCHVVQFHMTPVN